MKKWPALIIPVILIFALMLPGCLGTTSKETPSAPTTTIPQLEARIGALETAVAKLDKAVTPAELTSVKTDLATANKNLADATKSLSDTQAQLKVVADSLPNLTQRITNTETQLTVALARVTVLEKSATTTSTANPEDAVTVDYSSFTTPKLLANDLSFTYSLTIKLTNNLAVAIKNVEVILSFMPALAFPSYPAETPPSWAVDTGGTTLVGGSVPWGLVTATSPAQVVFVSGLLGAGSSYIGGTQAFSLKANETKTVMLSATLTFTPPGTTKTHVQISWNVNAYCNSYDVVK